MPTHPIALLLLLTATLGISACSSSQPPQTLTLAALDTAPPRQSLFNTDWRFLKADPQDAASPTLDDSAWRKLDLPHDWSIEGPFNQNLASATAFLPAGTAWYRKHFTLPESAKNQRLSLRFDAIYKNSTIYLNGKKIGGRAYGYSSFDLDLTPHLNPSGQNTLAIRVQHDDFADQRWYPGSGIIRNVHLITTNPLHVETYGNFVHTSYRPIKPNSDQMQHVVHVDNTVRFDPIPGIASDEPIVNVFTDIVDAEGKIVATNFVSGTFLKPGESTKFQQSFAITNPNLWSTDHPYLYTAVSRIMNGTKTLDTVSTPFGIRSFHFDPNTGFSLNGTPTKLKGVCLHEDAGALGAAIPREVWERRLRILKSVGTNAIRTSHNPPSPDFLDLCDHLGFLVMDEAFDEWSKPKKKWTDYWSGTKFSLDGYSQIFAENADNDLATMVLRDRNHPSIILWSIGNEIDYPNDPYPLNSQEPVEIAKRFVKIVKSLDTSRPVTAACAAIASNLYFPALDIVGYNYQENRYQADHAQFPNRIITGSENSKNLDAWQAVANNDFIPGQFLWTGIDFLGEAGPWPRYISTAGIFDIACFPKPDAHIRRALWSEEPFIILEPAQGGRGRRGAGGAATAPAPQPRGLVAYTNCDTLTFGSPQITMLTNSRALPLEGIDITKPFTITGKRKGQSVSTTYTPPGPPAKILLTQYPTTLGPAKGAPHIAQIELSIVDAQGNLVRSANPELHLTLDTNAKFLAMESGNTSAQLDPTHLEDLRSDHRKAFRGRSLLFIQPLAPTTLKVKAEGLPEATLELRP